MINRGLSITLSKAVDCLTTEILELSKTLVLEEHHFNILWDSSINNYRNPVNIDGQISSFETGDFRHYFILYEVVNLDQLKCLVQRDVIITKKINFLKEAIINIEKYHYYCEYK